MMHQPERLPPELCRKFEYAEAHQAELDAFHLQQRPLMSEKDREDYAHVEYVVKYLADRKIPCYLFPLLRHTERCEVPSPHHEYEIELTNYAMAQYNTMSACVTEDPMTGMVDYKGAVLLAYTSRAFIVAVLNLCTFWQSDWKYQQILNSVTLWLKEGVQWFSDRKVPIEVANMLEKYKQ